MNKLLDVTISSLLTEKKIYFFSCAHACRHFRNCACEYLNDCHFRGIFICYSDGVVLLYILNNF